MTFTVVLLCCILAGSKLASPLPVSSQQHELQPERSPSRSPEKTHSAPSPQRQLQAETILNHSPNPDPTMSSPQSPIRSSPKSSTEQDHLKHSAKTTQRVEEIVKTAGHHSDERIRLQKDDSPDYILRRQRYLENLRQHRNKKSAEYPDSSDGDEDHRRMHNHRVVDYHEHERQRRLLASEKAPPFSRPFSTHYDHHRRPPPPLYFGPGMHQVGPSQPPSRAKPENKSNVHKLRKKVRNTESKLKNRMKDAEAKLKEKAGQEVDRMADAAARKNERNRNGRHSPTSTTYGNSYYGASYYGSGGDSSSSRSSSSRNNSGSRRGWGIDGSPRSDSGRIEGADGQDVGFAAGITMDMLQGGGSGSSTPIHHRLLKGITGIFGGSGRSDSNTPAQDAPTASASSWLCGWGGCGGSDGDGGSGRFSGLKEAMPDPQTMSDGVGAALSCVGGVCGEVLKGTAECAGCLLGACVGQDCS